MASKIQRIKEARDLTREAAEKYGVTDPLVGRAISLIVACMAEVNGESPFDFLDRTAEDFR